MASHAAPNYVYLALFYLFSMPCPPRPAQPYAEFSNGWLNFAPESTKVDPSHTNVQKGI
jgi:hypothetical protein